MYTHSPCTIVSHSRSIAASTGIELDASTTRSHRPLRTRQATSPILTTTSALAIASVRMPCRCRVNEVECSSITEPELLSSTCIESFVSHLIATYAPIAEVPRICEHSLINGAHVITNNIPFNESSVKFFFNASPRISFGNRLSNRRYSSHNSTARCT